MKPWLRRTAYLLLVTLVLGSSLSLCTEKKYPQDDQGTTPFPSYGSFAKGADVGWLTEMESAGKKFYNNKGAEQECMQLLKSLGMNTIRLRVWVNPANGWNNKADVLVKALRAKNLGMRLMIDFHYSDNWADPGKQNKPATWANLTVPQLKDSLARHTRDVLALLRSNYIYPEWVQVGNETNDGMLWPEGKASTNMATFAQMIDTGYASVKAVFPSTKVIVHLSNGWDGAMFRWMFDGLKANNTRWDVIGMSMYPTPTNWQTLDAQCLATMQDMVARYGKEVMVVETGMNWDQPVACKAFLTDMITKVKSLPDKKGLGVLYWEPESYNNWKGYQLGAFDSTGKPTAALDAFK